AVFVAVMAAGAGGLRGRVRRRLEALAPGLASRARGAAAVAGGAGPRGVWALPVPDRRWRGGGPDPPGALRGRGGPPRAGGGWPAAAAPRLGIWMPCAGGCGRRRAAPTVALPSGSGLRWPVPGWSLLSARSAACCPLLSRSRPRHLLRSPRCPARRYVSWPTT